jgi:hypothetical protein
MIKRLFLASLLIAVASAAQAQTSSLAPSPMLACLAPMPGAPTTPVYPEEAFKRKDGARIAVELKFEGPDRAPKVDIARNDYVREFDEAVNEYAKNLRLPCMPAGAPAVTLKQNYVFEPNDGRKVMPPQSEDPADVQRRIKMACLTHVRPGWKPPYPSGSLRKGVDGKVLTRLTFTGPNTAPLVQHVAVIGGRDFRHTVELHSEGMRLPCIDQSPVSIDMVYQFVINGNGKTVLLDMSLRDLVASSEEVAPIKANLNAMACPFDVRLQYMQPYAPNRVHEVETTHPARRPVLDWLTGIRLRMSKTAGDAVFADTFTVTVPCGTIDL